MRTHRKQHVAFARWDGSAHGHDRNQSGCAPRSGISLILVMFALSMSLVLTYSFIQTQSVQTQISANGSRRDLARNAARAGISDALNRLNSLDWAGVSDRYRRPFQADDDGECTYTVSFEAVGNSLSSVLELNVYSLGVWTSAENPDMKSEHQITARVRLVPRLIGRTILPGDSAAATDQISNAGDFDRIKGYALFAEQGYYSLNFDPATRIDGNLWLYDRLHMFTDPAWSSTIRDTYLTDVGNRFVTFPAGSTSLSEATISAPHPIAGNITFYNYPSYSIRDDLSDLKVSWSTTTERLTIPSTDYSAFTSYRLYEGGPLYQAETVNSSLYNQTLKPTPANPLGIFYRSGNLSIYDNVTIQGTLVCTGKIYFVGKQIHLTAFNWKDDSGQAFVTDAQLWPRLPCVVAHDAEFSRYSQSTVEGAIVCQGTVKGGGGSISYPSALDLKLSGTATAASIGQPFSTVTLQEYQLLSSLSTDGNYAIWLETTGSGNTGTTGSWYPIVGFDNNRQQLTVRGEIDQATPTAYRIQRHKQVLTQVRGPVCAETFDFYRVNEWVLNSYLWDDRRYNWNYQNDLRKALGFSEIGFSEWLENPGNFLGWDSYYLTYGISLEPTLQIQNLTEREYRWAPPLFQPFDGGDANPDQSGYRWSMVDWQESF
ncbi:hypothetical protein [Gimesia panareensis]|uniref:hypothetical protein n=1 Tax=Gimesia panareensis TaxID=2527978 RepID=UPI00118C95A9|nr:hypothetical protein [Gimesia panareensis]QDU53806.1 hypothetical protein Pan110_62000 [Gimesia panareensis]